ncbi:MAG: hypothetical protein ATN35_04965 [Epulopiscium sp. Nele67-Bin004]|nr:MAG: hypothetical protein ATN35_04965 [Epulopiscium sp. Nele67-Bin004]
MQCIDNRGSALNSVLILGMVLSVLSLGIYNITANNINTIKLTQQFSMFEVQAKMLASVIIDDFNDILAQLEDTEINIDDIETTILNLIYDAYAERQKANNNFPFNLTIECDGTKNWIYITNLDIKNKQFEIYYKGEYTEISRTVSGTYSFEFGITDIEGKGDAYTDNDKNIIITSLPTIVLLTQYKIQ